MERNCYFGKGEIRVTPPFGSGINAICVPGSVVLLERVLGGTPRTGQVKLTP